MDCPACGAENPESFTHCSACALEFSQWQGGTGPGAPAPRPPRVGLWIGLGVGLIVLGVVWSVLRPQPAPEPAPAPASAQAPASAPAQPGVPAGTADIPTSEKQAVARTLGVNVINPVSIQRSVGGARQAVSGMTEDAQRTLDQADELLNPKADR